jgi:protein TonB
MKKKHDEVSWDDLIFENRNKEYGAYKIREKYAAALAVSLVSALVFSFGLVFFFHLQSLNRQITEYQEMFQFISVPMDLSELKNYNETEDLKIKTDSKKNKSNQYKITDSLTVDSVLEDKKKNIAPAEIEKADTLKKDSAVLEKTEKDVKLTVDSLFTVKDLPQFPGGQSAFNAYITNSLSLSEDVKKNKIHGLVQICFSIDKFGNPINVYIKKTVNADLDKTLFEIFKNMPRWIPSQKYNDNIKLTFTVPIIL